MPFAAAIPVISAIGGVVGGTAGTAMTVGGAVLGAGASIIGGMDDRQYANQQAAYSQQQAEINAMNTQRVGDWNSDAVMETAMMNSMLGMAAAGMEAKAIEMNAGIALEVASYNAGIRMMLGDYNARVIESEAFLVMKEAELNTKLLHDNVNRYVGETRSQFAASGVMVNEGTPVDVVIDARTQEKLEAFIIRTNADVQLTKIANSAAMSRWQGAAEAATILAEGNAAVSQARVNAKATLFSGMMGSMGNMFNATQESKRIDFETSVRVDEMMRGGAYTAQTYKDKGAMSFTSGLINAGTSLVTSYDKGAFDPLIEGMKAPFLPLTKGGGGGGGSQVPSSFSSVLN